MGTENILDGKAVAKMLKVSYRHVLRLAEKGELPAFQVGNLWRFRQSDLEDYINKQIQQNKKQI
jgi:excisionase family DNA binding protein